MSSSANIHHILNQKNTNIYEEIKQRLANIIPKLSCNFITTLLCGQIENVFDFVIRAMSNKCLAVALLLCASIYIFLAYRKRAPNKKNNMCKRTTRSLSMGALHGGEMAVYRLFEYYDARANGASLEAVENELQSLLHEELPDFKKLRRIMGRVEMSGKEGKAVEKLEGAVETARKQGKPHEAYEFQMLLVEMLIYKGDFRKALNCPCLEDQSITDVRRPLYKAIIHQLLEDCEEKEMKVLWKDFKKIQKHFRKSHHSQATQLHKTVKKFNTFKNIIKSLKDDIQLARINTN